MKADDFVKIAKELAKSKNLEWTSFRKDRIWEIGKRFEDKKDKGQAISEIVAELKSYNVNWDDKKFLIDRIK